MQMLHLIRAARAVRSLMATGFSAVGNRAGPPRRPQAL